ncbi:MAG: 5-oxoprolinase subunit PxpB [Alicyclobacillus macrosporangiidus]|nr:5-oxoprolinase subunit PxpB [Alicyclobacillus macrosporangiidus]
MRPEGCLRPVIRTAGDQAVLVEFEPRVDPAVTARVLALERWLEEHAAQGIYECVPGYCTLWVAYNPAVYSYAQICGLIERSAGQLDSTVTGHTRTLEIPVCYGGEFGPDIGDVAAHNGLRVEEVIEIHAAGEYFVHFTGFLPGFPFLGGLSSRIATPRMPKPRQAVPAGSVGIAGEQTGYYPITSPGGWRLIGRIPIRMYDPRREDPFIVHEGDRIRFVSITPDEFTDLKAMDDQAPWPIPVRYTRVSAYEEV